MTVRVLSICRRYQISVIRAHDPYLCGLVGLVAARLSGIPLAIMIFCNYELTYRVTGRLIIQPLRSRAAERLLERFVFGRADRVLAANEDEARYAIAAGAPRERTRVSRIVVDDVHFEPLEARADCRERFHLGHGPLLLYCGRLSPEKYPDDLVRCLPFVRDKFPKSTLVIVGDGPMREGLEELAGSLGVRSALIFLGFQSNLDVRDLMYSADVILSPLTGSALVEAALSTTPTVAYDIEWHRELIRNGETGLLVTYRDVRAFAEAAVKVLSNPERAAELGRAARELAIRQHSRAAIAEQERDYMSEILAQPAVPASS